MWLTPHSNSGLGSAEVTYHGDRMGPPDSDLNRDTAILGEPQLRPHCLQGAFKSKAGFFLMARETQVVQL